MIGLLPAGPVGVDVEVVLLPLGEGVALAEPEGAMDEDGVALGAGVCGPGPVASPPPQAAIGAATRALNRITCCAVFQTEQVRADIARFSIRTGRSSTGT